MGKVSQSICSKLKSKDFKTTVLVEKIQDFLTDGAKASEVTGENTILIVEDPENIDKTDLDKVKSQGWGEREIFDAIVQAAYNRAFNSILRTFNIEHQGAFT